MEMGRGKEKKKKEGQASRQEAFLSPSIMQIEFGQTQKEREKLQKMPKNNKEGRKGKKERERGRRQE